MNIVETSPKSSGEQNNDDSATGEVIQDQTKIEEIMEVHKHPHRVTESKKISEYILEFFMIFFAVFLGFVAENLREEGIDRKKGKQYLEAYKADLLENKAVITQYEKTYLSLLFVYDSISDIFYGKRENAELKKLRSLLGIGKRNIAVPLSLTNYSQIINSGSLRLIESDSVTRGMAKYYDLISAYREFELTSKDNKNGMYAGVAQLEDLHDFWQFDKNGNAIFSSDPTMDPYPPLTDGQRRLIINYYRFCIVQTRGELSQLRNLLTAGDKLLELISESE